MAPHTFTTTSLVAVIVACALMEPAASASVAVRHSSVLARAPSRFVTRAPSNRRAPGARLLLPTDPLRRQSAVRDSRYRSQDWLANILSIPASRVLRRIGFHLTANVIWGAVVLVLRSKGVPLKVPALPLTILGGFLSLLLVFRTNSAYARFWEGRIIWGGIMNTCRNLAQYAVTHLRRVDMEIAGKFIKLLACFPHALAHRCVSGRIPHEDRVKAALPAPQWANIPSNVLLEMRELIRLSTVKLSEKPLQESLDTRLQLNEMVKRVDDLVDGLGKCERILRSPIPLSYSRHTSRFLTVWCAALPMVLCDMGLFMLPALTIICWALFSIEEIGHLIEMPFVPSLYPISDSTGVTPERLEMERQRKQPHPYSYGVPVEVMASVICAEVEDIASTDYGSETKNTLSTSFYG